MVCSRDTPMLRALLVILGLAISLMANAEESFNFMNLREVSIDYNHYTWAINPFLAPTFKPTNKLDLNLKVNYLNDWIFTDFRVHSQTDQTQYRLIGLNYQIGIHAGSYIDVYFDHFSQHLLDYPIAMPNTFDAIAVKFYIYRGDKR